MSPCLTALGFDHSRATDDPDPTSHNRRVPSGYGYIADPAHPDWEQLAPAVTLPHKEHQ